MVISLIAAVGDNRVIGKDNDLIWHLPDDMKFFSATTKGHFILTGRKNYESIPEKFRPLPHRENIVVTRQEGYEAPGAHVVSSISKGIALAKAKGESELFIIGGGEIYKQCMKYADKMYLTHVNDSPEGDAFFPVFYPKDWEVVEERFHPIDEKHKVAFTFKTYFKKSFQ